MRTPSRPSDQIKTSRVQSITSISRYVLSIGETLRGVGRRPPYFAMPTILRAIYLQSPPVHPSVVWQLATLFSMTLLLSANISKILVEPTESKQQLSSRSVACTQRGLPRPTPRMIIFKSEALPRAFSVCSQHSNAPSASWDLRMPH